MDFSKMAEQALLISKDVEYSTFSTAVEVPKDTLRKEEDLFKREGISGKQAFKTIVNREFREYFEKVSGKRWSKDGDVTFTLHLPDSKLNMKINPIFILCKYNKFSRELSQTRWEKYKSVEGYIVEAANRVFGSSNAFLHGAGREDVDVRMLGEGRLCVVEIVEPKRRNVDLSEYERMVKEISGGSVELHVIRKVNGEYVWIVKEAGFDKEYIAEAEFERELNDQDIKNICSISAIEQRTPERVKHRRADLIRRKKIYKIECTSHNLNRAVFKITTEAGTYVKELITGDNGRTKPSFASVVQSNAKCLSLDVINVYEYISEWW